MTDDNPKVALAFRGRVRLGIMPVSLFMTGRTYCLQRLDKVGALCPSFPLGANVVTINICTALQWQHRLELPPL